MKQQPGSHLLQDSPRRMRSTLQDQTMSNPWELSPTLGICSRYAHAMPDWIVVFLNMNDGDVRDRTKPERQLGRAEEEDDVLDLGVVQYVTRKDLVQYVARKDELESVVEGQQFTFTRQNLGRVESNKCLKSAWDELIGKITDEIQLMGPLQSHH